MKKRLKDYIFHTFSKENLPNLKVVFILYFITENLYCKYLTNIEKWRLGQLTTILWNVILV